MTPTLDFMRLAEKSIHALLLELRPQLLEAHGSIEHQLKDDKSVVTAMDLMVENRLRDLCRELNPAIGFGGEETGVDLTQKTFWLADPIDGTEAFIRGLPFSTNMIALIHSGQAVMSIVYNFFLDEYFVAIRGQGATRNGHAIHVSERPLKQSFVVLNGFYELHVPLRPQVRGIPKMHASGYELSAVAAGTLDGAIVGGTKGPWDHAPGTLLILEAGGRVENIGSAAYDYLDFNYVAANPVNFDELKAVADAADKPGR